MEPMAGGTHSPSSGIGAGGVSGETEKGRNGVKKDGQNTEDGLQWTDCGEWILEDGLQWTKVCDDRVVPSGGVCRASRRVCSGIGTLVEQRHSGE